MEWRIVATVVACAQLRFYLRKEEEFVGDWDSEVRPESGSMALNITIN